MPKLPRLTPADDATTHEVDDAASMPQPPPPRPGATYTQSRPKKTNAYVAGMPIAAAIVKDVEEIRRSREEAVQLAAALHTGRTVKVPASNLSLRQAPAPLTAPALSPRTRRTVRAPPKGDAPATSARGPSPRRAAAANAAALQDAASRQAGLDREQAPAVALDPAPASRLGYAHDEPQAQVTPFVAPHASDAMEVGIAAAARPPAVGHDGWSSRTVVRGAHFDGIVSGPSALVMSEVEAIVRKAGVTADTIADAGLSEEEARRLMLSLYAHSAGFVQLLGETFGDQPHRVELLKRVWTGFASLVEAVQSGIGGVDYASVMLAQDRDATRAYERLEAEFERTSAHLQAALDTSRAETAAADRRAAAQAERAEAAEGLAARTEGERDEARAGLRRTEAALQAEGQQRALVEARLERELESLAPLKAKAAGLASARAEADQAKAAAKARASELATTSAKVTILDEKLRTTTALGDALAGEVAIVDEQLHLALSAHAAARAAVAELEEQLVGERSQIQAMEVRHERAAVEAKQARNEVLKQLEQQMDEAVAAKKARGEADSARLAAERTLEERDDELRQKEEDLAAAATQSSEAGDAHAQLEREVATARAAQADAETAAAMARAAEASALDDAAAVKEKCKAMIDEVGKCREQEKLARNECDQLKLSSYRELDAMRTELREGLALRDLAVADKETMQEAMATLEERVRALEASLQEQRRDGKKREVVHAEHLVTQEEQALKARRDIELAAKRERERAEEEARSMRETLAQVGTLLDGIGSMKESIAQLTADNECYGAEVRSYEEALGCFYELRSTCEVVRTLGNLVGGAETVGVMTHLHGPIGSDLVEQLALQAEQQRAIDATERGLEEALGLLAEVTGAWDGELSPQADAASQAVRDVPNLKEDLLQAGLLRSETLALLRSVRDAADDERQKHLRELSAAQKKAAQDAEQAAFAQQLQASQIANLNRELAKANEELDNWRSGVIRLANAKAWREERATLGSGAGLSAVAAAGSPGPRHQGAADDGDSTTDAMRYQRQRTKSGAIAPPPTTQPPNLRQMGAPARRGSFADPS